MVRQNWWQQQLAQRGDKVEWLEETELTKAIYWAHHHLNWMTFSCAARQGEHRKTWLGARRQCQRESLINRREPKNYYKEWLMKSFCEVGIFFCSNFNFSSTFPWVCIFIPFLLKEFWLDKLPSILPLMIPVIALFMITKNQFNYLARRTGLLLLYSWVRDRNMSRF